MEYRYQLQIEDAERISRESRVVFVDASVESLPGGFEWRRCAPWGTMEFTSHALTASAVLRLCEQLYGRSPRAHLLAIEGSEWGLGAGLSATAKRNLTAALGFFEALKPKVEKNAA
jgi:hypothetical protein